MKMFIFFSMHSQISTCILRKYSGPIDIWLSMLLPLRYTDGMTHCLLNEHPRKSFHAMAEHSSQWVWYVCCHNLRENSDHILT